MSKQWNRRRAFAYLQWRWKCAKKSSTGIYHTTILGGKVNALCVCITILYQMGKISIHDMEVMKHQLKTKKPDTKSIWWWTRRNREGLRNRIKVLKELVKENEILC